jgi:hypothetical protein
LIRGVAIGIGAALIVLEANATTDDSPGRAAKPVSIAGAVATPGAAGGSRLASADAELAAATAGLRGFAGTAIELVIAFPIEQRTAIKTG